jgi:hypothetical protein
MLEIIIFPFFVFICMTASSSCHSPGSM